MNTRRSRIGQTKTVNGVTYTLNKNSRWERTTPRDRTQQNNQLRTRGAAGDFTGNDNDSQVVDELLNNWGEGISGGNTISDYENFVKKYEQDLADVQDDLDELLENNATPEELMEFAHDLRASDMYQDMVHTSVGKGIEYTHLKDQYSEDTKALNDYIANGYDGDLNPEDMSRMYDTCQEAVQAYDDYKMYGDMLEGYKNAFATAMDAAQKGRTSDRLHEFTGDTIGENMVMVGETIPGSREWHELRQTGFGASDIGALNNSFHYVFDEEGNPVLDDKGKHKKERNSYNDANLERLYNSKINPVTDDQIEDQTNIVAHDAATRGHALEDTIGELAARKLGINLLHNKGTWSKPGSAVNINYDFMMTSDGVHPDGNFEIKTAKDPTKWGKEELGIDGIPQNYRAQALAGCYEAGFKRGGLAVLINEGDLRTYTFDMTPELVEEAKKNSEQAQLAYQNIENDRKTGDTTFNKAKFGMKTRPFNPHRFDNKLPSGVTKILKTKPMTKDRERFLRSIANMRGLDTSDPAVMNNVTNEWLSMMPTDIKTWTPEQMTNSLNRMYVNSAPYVNNMESVAGIDMECTALSATRGRPIEIGVTTMNMKTGQSEKRLDSLYGLNKQSADHTGTGAEDVHHISMDDIADKRILSRDPKAQQEVIDSIVGSGGLVYAHNDTYEKSFLRGHVKGFAEAEARGDIRFVDSMDITRHTMVSSPNAKMSSFTEGNGVAYEGAHRAYQDADMMLRAVHNYFGGQFGGEKHLQDMARE